jgi:uncharacterized membrane protein YbjE (DUF340 family)
MPDAGADVTHSTTVTEAIDRASGSVQAACDLLRDAIERLAPLLADCDGPEAARAVAGYTTARDLLLPQLHTLDRARAAAGG